MVSVIQTAFSQHFQEHFLYRECSCFDSNFNWIYHEGSEWRYIIIALENELLFADPKTLHEPFMTRFTCVHMHHPTSMISSHWLCAIYNGFYVIQSQCLIILTILCDFEDYSNVIISIKYTPSNILKKCALLCFVLAWRRHSLLMTFKGTCILHRGYITIADCPSENPGTVINMLK